MFIFFILDFLADLLSPSMRSC